MGENFGGKPHWFNLMVRFLHQFRFHGFSSFFSILKFNASHIFFKRLSTNILQNLACIFDSCFQGPRLEPKNIGGSAATVAPHVRQRRTQKCSNHQGERVWLGFGHPNIQWLNHRHEEYFKWK